MATQAFNEGKMFCDIWEIALEHLKEKGANNMISIESISDLNILRQGISEQKKINEEARNITKV